ncbi:putative nucleotidyltransferase substrate binding domain-containing protein [Ketobacter sp.]|uniref:putative nucleotidyltransferase substrate binding domain-containing protein n=1 Tax=Ketobacter sp. TaxID=2083498 RepID=UPI000F155A22|nr:putative nucleotidyltransferase substrate binding domain-containing protein [Ketobacter sp.]RLT96849.1 MAG: cyclic nucleotide-binding/CBS domain-containing protein [Ketobacter sp.]
MTSDPNHPEIQAVADFLRQCLPFNELPEAALQETARQIRIVYVREGHPFSAAKDEYCLRIVRSGAVEIRSSRNQLMDRLGEGESFNIHGLEMGEEGVHAQVIEDSLIYQLPQVHYESLRARFRDFDRHFHSQRSRRLRRAARYQPNTNMMMLPIDSLVSRNPLTLSPDASLQEAALAMTGRRVSSVLVMEDSTLCGIVTDRDLRSRALAKGLPLDTPIRAIMTPQPQHIESSASLFDAILLMTQQGIHHLPVLQEGRVFGIITSSDLMLARKDDPVYLVQHLSRQTTTDGMRAIIETLPNLLVEVIKGGMRAHQISRVLTAISDTVTSRLIELAIEELGPPPVPFCWLGFGSQARGEQLIGADQDNGLLLDDRATEQDRAWFTQLAQRVCDGLNACGYPYCNGKVMATTDEWRQPLQGWKTTVDQWTRTPTPDAVMRVSIFFDLRAVYGDPSLCQRLQQHMLLRTQKDTIFLAALAANVLEQTPPLGIFRRFVVERNGEHRDEFDIKKRGVMPIVDLVRIHALAHGVAAVNTRERVQQLKQKKVFTIGDGRNLLDAYDTIQQLRVENQSRQIAAGHPASNYLNPKDLPELERKHLKDAFTIVHDSQEALRNRYRQGL